MKLYTEEEIMNYLINHKSTITRYDLQNIPHIELPSDDEIKKESLKTDFEYTFRNGVMWMRDKIQGGNK